MEDQNLVRRNSSYFLFQDKRISDYFIQTVVKPYDLECLSFIWNYQHNIEIEQKKSAKYCQNKKTAYLNRYNEQCTRKLSLKSLKEDKKPNTINLPLCSCMQARAAPWRRLVGCTEETRAKLHCIRHNNTSIFVFSVPTIHCRRFINNGDCS